MIYTFWSVNGGVGKTTLSVAIAYNIAKRNKNKKVLLIDYNLVNPDTDMHIKIQPTDMKELYRYIVSKSLNESILTTYIREHDKLSNFFVLSGLYDINYFDKLTVKDFTLIIELAKKMGYDYIFLDIDSSVHIDATFVALTNADKVFVVTDGMYHSIRNTNRYITDILSKISIDDDNIEIIVNKFDREVSHKEEVRRLLGRLDSHFIEFNKEVMRFVNKGIPFVECKEKKAKTLISSINELTDYMTKL